MEYLDVSFVSVWIICVVGVIYSVLFEELISLLLFVGILFVSSTLYLLDERKGDLRDE